jgi:hypothetical protein
MLTSRIQQFLRFFGFPNNYYKHNKNDKSSCARSPIWLHHKIEKTNPQQVVRVTKNYKDNKKIVLAYMVYSQIQLYLPMGGLPHWLATSQNSFKKTLCSSSSKTKAQKRKKKKTFSAYACRYLGSPFIYHSI